MIEWKIVRHFLSAPIKITHIHGIYYIICPNSIYCLIILICCHCGWSFVFINIFAFISSTFLCHSIITCELWMHKCAHKIPIRFSIWLCAPKLFIKSSSSYYPSKHGLALHVKRFTITSWIKRENVRCRSHLWHVDN